MVTWLVSLRPYTLQIYPTEQAITVLTQFAHGLEGQTGVTNDDIKEFTSQLAYRFRKTQKEQQMFNFDCHTLIEKTRTLGATGVAKYACACPYASLATKPTPPDPNDPEAQKKQPKDQKKDGLNIMPCARACAASVSGGTEARLPLTFNPLDRPLWACETGKMLEW